MPYDEKLGSDGVVIAPDNEQEEVMKDVVMPVTVIAETETTALVQAILEGASGAPDAVRVWVPKEAVSGGTCNLSHLRAGMPYGDSLELLLTPSEVARTGEVLAAELRKRDLWHFSDLQDGTKVQAVEQAIRATLVLTTAHLRRRSKQLGGQ